MTAKRKPKPNKDRRTERIVILLSPTEKRAFDAAAAAAKRKPNDFARLLCLTAQVSTT